ncbi:unnamed protein product [Parnassius apollo]|uniref:(apollo) hypothetical protein n=1 Tax=Parnassius apollo TaxID=110799 RepID=A0A8S3WXW7_PARAO|nr:unnamed protein product [Parnassius apollo]
MNTKFYFFIYYLISGYDVTSISYDQSQTGELNVQVDLKDIQIIALMKGGKEEYVDYDYAYDYSEMTIKPQNRTTPKPLQVYNGTSAVTDSVRDNTTIAATVFAENTTVAASIKTSSETWNTTAYEYTTTSRSTVITENETIAENKNVTSTTESTSSCKMGFLLNHKGECVLKVQGTGNALLKLVKLSQKLKLRRENKSNPED